MLALRSLLITWIVMELATPSLAAPPDARELEFFEKKIRPVLIEHCYRCHSADAETRGKLRGGLLVDSRAGLLQGGDTGTALVPEKPGEGTLLAALRYDGDVRMPPKGKLPDQVIADFETWIKMGAPDPRVPSDRRPVGTVDLEKGRQFWAYQTPRRHPLPEVRRRDWPTGDIDRWILAKLEASSLSPAEEADRATLARRLYFDLIGLPPTPAQVDAFLADARPDAYERLVEQLLASPHFGERWGRHWLDVVRFGESLTLRGFILKEAWRYRDHVIQAINDDMPFDQFLREQIAGDLLPSDDLGERRRRLIATTFLVLGNTNLEEQDKKQLRMDVVDEQLDVIGKGILAQTITCARCHDHKFDPIPTRDYYALAGILRNTKALEHANVSRWLEMPLPAEPAIEEATRRHQRLLAELEARIKTEKARLGDNKKPGKRRILSVKDVPGIVIDDTQAKKVGQWKESQFSGSYVGTGYLHDDNADKGSKTLTFQPDLPHTGKYEVWLAYAAGGNRSAAVPVTIFSAEGEKMVEVNQQQPATIDGFFLSLGEYLFENSGQHYVLVGTDGTQGHVVVDAVVFLPVEKRKALLSSRPTTDQEKVLARLEAELKQLRAAAPPREMAMSVEEEKTIEDVRIHVRGSVHNLGELAPRGFLRVAERGPPARLSPRASGRRELADWLASRDNPLTARVFVNRAWHWVFGAGLVRTVDNFGTTGELPSHPELLDQLAVDFMDRGWSIKSLVRQLVLSRTYRQSTMATTPGSKVDPENRLLGRMNRRRMDAESLRDAMLAFSGQLRLERGGRSFDAKLESDYNYQHNDTRRSVYVPVFRNALPDLFQAFDFADPSMVVGRRDVSTVAPQALFLMNHPFVLEQARQTASRLLQVPGSSEERVTRATRWILGRQPTSQEQRLARRFLDKHGETSESWALFVQALLGSVDFRYLY